MAGTGGRGGAVVAGGDAGAIDAGGDGGSPVGRAGQAGADGTHECGDCSLPAGEVCVVGVCDTELGRCARQPIVACRSGDGCCPTGCAQVDDDDCNSVRIELAPAHSGNRSEAGALGATTFAGVLDEQRFLAFFDFDLSGITGTIDSAELDLYYDGYFSSDPDEHFVVQAGHLPSEALVDTALRPDVYDALQSGGSYCFDSGMTADHVGSTVPFELNETTLTALSANLGSSVTFGIVADTTLGISGNTEGIRFSDGATAPVERLILFVEP